MKYKIPSELSRFLVLVRPVIISNYLKNSEEPKLHIGCGSNYVEGWLNADKFDSRADIYLNAYNKMPFRDNTFRYLYSEHMLEHLKITKVKKFLQECHRILEPGGIFRITVPDLELMATKYVERDEEFFKPYLRKGEIRRAQGNEKFWLVRSYGGVLNMIGTPYYSRHRWFYDFDTIRLCGEEIGFSEITKLSYGESQADVLGKMDQEKRAHETLYAELKK